MASQREQKRDKQQDVPITPRADAAPPPSPFFHDADTEIRIPQPAGREFCSEHTEIVRLCSETHTLVKSQETLLRGMAVKQEEQAVAVAEMRRDLTYHSKFWGAVAGAVTAACAWVLGHVVSK